MSKKIQIKLLPNGEIQIETFGIKGKKCLDYTKIINKIVNGKISKTELKPDFYETEEIINNDNNINIKNLE